MDSSVAELRQLLGELGVDAVLIGAHAANRYRLDVRFTADVDFLVDRLVGVADALRSRGWSVRAVAEDGVDYLLSAKWGNFVVDLLLAETTYQRTAMERAEGGVLAVEDVIVHKLIAGRPRDRDDIASILAADVSLDEGYIAEHAAAWDVDGLWRSLRADGAG